MPQAAASAPLQLRGGSGEAHLCTLYTFPTPPTPFLPAWIPSLVVEGFGPSLVLFPLCFLLQPPLGFLLIPVYSIFYKSL